MDGILPIDKPRDMSSRKLCSEVKRLLAAKKVGSTGTLDPHASGLMLLCVNNATKLVSVLQKLDKEYLALAKFHSDVKRTQLTRVLERFKGEIVQIPPKRSSVARRPRKRRVYELKVLEFGKREAKIYVKCEAGTYVRKLIHDIGTKLGGAHLQELRRIAIGYFRVEDAVSFEEFVRSKDSEKFLLPMERCIKHLKRVTLKWGSVKGALKGAPIFRPGILGYESRPDKGEVVAVFSPSDDLIALGKWIGGNIALRIDRVIRPNYKPNKRRQEKQSSWQKLISR